MSETSDQIFAKIARRYDRINQVLSWGREGAWRKRAAAHLPPGRVLDLGSGTGAALDVFGDRSVVGLDPVVEMLRLSPMQMRVAAVGEALPFPDASFDGVFSAYVFRNLTSVAVTLGEAARVLRPGGRAVIVDLGRPKNKAAAALHRMGSSVFLPLAGLIAGAPSDYWYLHKSLDKLAPPETLYVAPGLVMTASWRMGPLGFVHAVVLEKT